MPRKDLTDITLVIDRSGSRSVNRDEAEGGINNFIEGQKKAAGEATLTLVEFDDQYDFLHRGIDVKEAPKYSLVPRGWTALFDAVGKAIAETKERLDKIGEENRPDTVIFVVDTDGQENHSKEFTWAKVQESIKLQRETHKWEFVFLGASLASFQQGAAMGVAAANVAQYAPENARRAYGMVGDKLGAMRSSKCMGQSVMSNAMEFNDDERKELKAEMKVDMSVKADAKVKK